MTSAVLPGKKTPTRNASDLEGRWPVLDGVRLLEKPGKPLTIAAISMKHRRPTDARHVGRDAQRNLAAIEEALEAAGEAFNGGPGLVVFSLWTVPEGGRAEDLIQAWSRRFPIMYEAVGARDRWIFRISQGGRVVAEARQRFARSVDRRTPEYRDLGARLSDGRRVWRHPETGHRFIVLICGEMNVCVGGGSGGTPTWDATVVDRDQLASFRTHGVVNPSHTRFGPQAMRDKHEQVSREGVTISCNNISEDYQADNGCWVRGKRQGDDPVPLEGSHMRIVRLPRI